MDLSRSERVEIFLRACLTENYYITEMAMLYVFVRTFFGVFYSLFYTLLVPLPDVKIQLIFQQIIFPPIKR